MQTRSMLKHSRARHLHVRGGSPSSRTRTTTERSDEPDAETLLHKLLLTLDSAAVVRAVKVLAADRQGRRYLQRQALWDRLLTKHFGGRRGPRSDRFGTSNCSDEDEWGDNDYESTAAPSSRDACKGVARFLALTEDYNRFQENVVVVKGDIEKIKELGGHTIDGIAFPANFSLQHSSPGAAGAVSRRAGDRLLQHIRGVSFVSTAGSVFVSPGFDAGVSKLIHAVGPHVAAPQCYELLASTYRNIMTAVQSHNVKCLALASISTGTLGVPCREGARTALRAIQRFLSETKWTGVVGVVCYEQKVFDAFKEEKQALLEDFNAEPQ